MTARNEQGFVLVAVLWILILLSLISATLSFEARSGSHVARNAVDYAAARAAADAGIQRAILDLVGPPVGPSRFRTDGTTYAWQFAHCNVRISIRDEASKIDLNKAPEALFAALLMSVGVDREKAQSLAGAIGDFRDADSLVRPGGAEAADYRAAGLAWKPKNAPFQTVEELQQVLGMTGDIYARIAPDLSVHSLTSVIPATTDQRLINVLRAASLDGVSQGTSPEVAFSIRAEAKTANGGMFVRRAIVQPSAESGPLILSWEG